MITPIQCRMARAALRLGVRELAELAGVSALTVTRFETGQSSGQGSTLVKLRAAFEAAGVQFGLEPGRESVHFSPPKNSTARPMGDADG